MNLREAKYLMRGEQHRAKAMELIATADMKGCYRDTARAIGLILNRLNYLESRQKEGQHYENNQHCKPQGRGRQDHHRC